MLLFVLLQEYLRLNMDYRQRALILLATGFGVDRGRVDGLMQHYLKLKSGVSNLTFLSLKLSMLSRLSVCRIPILYFETGEGFYGDRNKAMFIVVLLH